MDSSCSVLGCHEVSRGSSESLTKRRCVVFEIYSGQRLHATVVSCLVLGNILFRWQDSRRLNGGLVHFACHLGHEFDFIVLSSLRTLHLPRTTRFHRNSTLSKLALRILSLFPASWSIVTSLEKRALLRACTQQSSNLFVRVLLNCKVLALGTEMSLFSSLWLIFVSTAQEITLTVFSIARFSRSLIALTKLTKHYF